MSKRKKHRKNQKQAVIQQPSYIPTQQLPQKITSLRLYLKKLLSFTVSEIVALVLLFITVALTVGGIIDMLLVHLFLSLAGIFAVIGIIASEWIITKSIRGKVFIFIASLILTSGSLYGLDKWIGTHLMARVLVILPTDGQKVINEHKISVQLSNGIAKVAFRVVAVGSVTARGGVLWIRICDGCKYASKPTINCKECEGFTVDEEHLTDAEVSFNHLYPKVPLPIMQIEVIPPAGANSTEIKFFYTCENCPKIDDEGPQKIMVYF